MKYPAEVLINGTDATAFWAVSVGGDLGLRGGEEGRGRGQMLRVCGL